jgi:hypothetical protein
MRMSCSHVRGCWALDLILGKEPRTVTCPSSLADSEMPAA